MMKDETVESREWQAFWAIIDLPMFRGVKYESIMSYVDRQHATIDWPAIARMMSPWSHGEQVLLRVARALFNATDNVPLHELSVLDDTLGPTVLGIIHRRYWPARP